MKTFINLILTGKKIKTSILSAGLTILMMLGSLQFALGQQFATSSSIAENPDGLATATVSDPDEAEGIADAEFATITATGVVASELLTNASNASLTLNFATPIAAGKRTYVRISAPTQIGLVVDLGAFVDLLGLLTANKTIDVTTGAGTAEYFPVKDGANNLYIAVTSSTSYSSITIKVDFAKSAGLLGLAAGSVSLNVWHAVTYENTEFTPCEALTFSFVGVNPQATGISITLSDALQNPQNSIDGIVNIGNYSLLQNGTVAVASNVYETVYLGKTVPGTNEVVATISRPGALADLSVLANITIQAYDGATAIGSPRSVSSLLSVDLLTAFTNAAMVSVTFVPGGTVYDRIVVRSQTLAGANLFTGLRIHELGSRPPITFFGGEVAGVIAGNAISSSILEADEVETPVDLPGFEIGCGVPSSFTYSLYNVTQGARVLAGTLPASLSLTQQGVLQGTTTVGDEGTYIFDVEARNIFGQRAVAQFVVIIGTPLPVTLTSFSAKAEGETALLSWTTTSETNSDRFDVERSQNGKTWTRIGTVMSNHESSTLQHYFFTDASPLSGENLYRLKMIDLDGTFANSSIRNLMFNPEAAVKLYPNPVTNTQDLQISVADWSKVKSIVIINAIGKTIFESSGLLSEGIKTEYLSSGLYVVKVLKVDGKTEMHKFVKL